MPTVRIALERECARAAFGRGACAHGHRFNRIAHTIQMHDIVVVEELRAAFFAQLGQLLREHAGIAAFVGVREGAAGDVIAIGLEGGLDLEQLFLAHDAALHAVATHHFNRFASRFVRFLIGVEVGDAAFQTLELEVRLADHFLERRVAVGTQGHDLLDIALERRVIALTEELEQPTPLVRVHLGAQQQRRFLVEQPLDRLERRVAVRPRLAVAHRDLRAVGKTGLQRRIGLAIHNDDFVTAL